jgi:protein-S-isoprenylcysteine O-methyltransferase Ste14
VKIYLHMPPPLYALLLLGLCWLLETLLPLPLDMSAPILAWILVGAGLGLIAWAFWHFLRLRTTPIPTGEPSALVTSGPYRYTRNPMYAGLLALLAGAVFFLGSPFYLLAAYGFFLIVQHGFIPYEEARLENRFGPAYLGLKKATPRWFW